jgi:hypothetical protein
MTTETALPPDVRRWLCPAVSVGYRVGAVPLVRALPLNGGAWLFANK